MAREVTAEQKPSTAALRGTERREENMASISHERRTESYNPRSSQRSLSPLAHEPDVGGIIAAHHSVSNASSLASIDRLPSEKSTPSAKTYPPLSLPVLALLAPASVFGVLARLGLQAIAHYDGESIFPLAYAQVLGCFIMGCCLALKEPLGQMYVR
jgi:CrcB protein